MGQNIRENTIEKELPFGLLNWYPWRKGVSVCCLGINADLFATELQSRGLQVTTLLETDKTVEGFDYIIEFGELERSQNPIALLQEWKTYLKPTGHLFLACENRLGLRYFCGDKDSFTHRNFDGIEDYRNFSEKDREFFGGRNYARYELEHFLDEAGFDRRRGYSVLPGLEMPQQLYAWDYLPREKLAIRYTPLYHDPKTVFLNEEQLYDSMIANGMFHQMANAYLIDCSPEGDFYEINHVTTSMDRGHENATATILRKDNTVEKIALYPEGNERLDALLSNTQTLGQRGIAVVPIQKIDRGEWENKKLTGITMEYIHSATALEYLRNLIWTNPEDFKSETIRYLQNIIDSSEPSETQPNEELGTFYQNAFTDMVPLNCFYHKGQFVFFDQEFCEQDYPINVVLVRALDILYMGDKSMEAVVPSEFFFEYFGLKDKLGIFRSMGSKYIGKLRQREALEEFNRKHLADTAVINSNRQRMNYSAEEYQHIFVDLLRDTEDKDVYLFGAGLWARKFIAEYGDRCRIRGLLDNNESNVGNMVDGVEVMCPSVLEKLDANQYKVIVCVKYYTSILVQLKRLGNLYYGIYDPYIERPVEQTVGRNQITVHREADGPQGKDSSCLEENRPKKYGTGYIAGVFDLFHVGHLNMFKRAREQCEYLIVGVVSDEQASEGKARRPYISEEDRLEIVRSCRYVDEAFILPYAAAGTRDVYRKYHFDAQFSGSDYEHDPEWLKEQQWLRERGSDLVFFPYTERTSSTKIKEQLSSERNLGK